MIALTTLLFQIRKKKCLLFKELFGWDLKRISCSLLVKCVQLLYM